MKICFLIHDMTARAGSERAQANLANALAARGDSISIWSCYRQNRSPGFPLSSGVEVVYGSRNPLPWFLDYPRIMCSFALFVLRSRPRWIVCTDANRLVLALFAACLPGVRLAVWEHFALSHSITKIRGRATRWASAVLASRIITLTERDRELYGRLFAPTCPVSAIPNVIKLSTLGRANRRRQILALGRLVPQKGFDLLLKAWALAAGRLRDWSLRIVGDGHLRDELMRTTAALGIEQTVTFAPFTEDPFSLFAQCGIFILSSRFEGLPFVLVEAMTCGTPCISFDCPNGPRELIRDGINGVLVPAERVDALADAMVRLGEDTALRRRLGEVARNVSEQFSEARVATKWQELLGD